jgi:drug/metabolite transporter (DMT)-like permease
VAFASNSILCRLALASAAIDPFAFTAVRIGSGALVLSIVALVRRRPRPRGNSENALAPLAYALSGSRPR